MQHASSKVGFAYWFLNLITPQNTSKHAFSLFIRYIFVVSTTKNWFVRACDCACIFLLSNRRQPFLLCLNRFLNWNLWRWENPCIPQAERHVPCQNVNTFNNYIQLVVSIFMFFEWQSSRSPVPKTWWTCVWLSSEP